MRTGSKSPLLPAIIREQTNEKLQTGKKVKPKHVEPSKPTPLKIWTDTRSHTIGKDGVTVVIENTVTGSRTKLPMTFEQYVGFLSGVAAFVTPVKSTS
jgi:hypothetical protein